MTLPWFSATDLSTGDPALTTKWCRRREAASRTSPRAAWLPARSKKTELKLVGVARASLEELLLDYQDYLRQHGLPLRGKDHPQAKQVRGLCYRSDRSYLTYKPYIEAPASAETAANTMVCIIHQANYLLDQQLRALEQEFLKEGGFTEKLYHARQQMRNSGRKP